MVRDRCRWLASGWLATGRRAAMATRRARITRTALKGLVPGAAPYVVWDTEVAGLGVKVHPSGRATYLCQYRIKGLRAAKQPVIGSIAAMSPEEARERARELLEAARRGVDPVGREKAAARAAASAAAAEARRIR